MKVKKHSAKTFVVGERWSYGKSVYSMEVVKAESPEAALWAYAEERKNAAGGYPGPLKNEAEVVVFAVSEAHEYTIAEADSEPVAEEAEAPAEEVAADA